MKMNYWDFLESAQKLLNAENNELQEVDYRNAASRAYYAALHACKGLIQQKDKKELGASHQVVINALKQHSNKQLRQIGNGLAQLRGKRINADYELNSNFSIQDAKFAIRLARKLQEKIADL